MNEQFHAEVKAMDAQQAVKAAPIPDLVAAVSKRKLPLPSLASALDFTERVGSTAIMAGLSVYLLDPQPATVRVALGAAAISALKFVYVKMSVWQAANVK